MTESENVNGSNCQTLKGLVYSFGSPENHGILITETQLSTAYTYLHGNSLWKDDPDTRMQDLARSLADVLVPRLIEKQDLVKMLNNRRVCIVQKDGNTSYVLFERKNGDETEMTLSSNMLGIDINVVDLGQNLAFSIKSNRGSGDTHHVGAEKALDESGCWVKRIEQISLTSIMACFENGNHDTELACHVYPYHPHKLISQMLHFVPKSSKLEIDSKEIFRSFISDDNHGVQVCEVFGVPVYMRFKREHVPGGGEHIWRLAQGVRQVDNTIFMRSAKLRIEFLIKSCAKSYDFRCDRSINYFDEQSRMKRTAQALYLGLLLDNEAVNFARKS